MGTEVGNAGAKALAEVAAPQDLGDLHRGF